MLHKINVKIDAMICWAHSPGLLSCRPEGRRPARLRCFPATTHLIQTNGSPSACHPDLYESVNELLIWIRYWSRETSKTCRTADIQDWSSGALPYSAHITKLETSKVGKGTFQPFNIKHEFILSFMNLTAVTWLKKAGTWATRGWKNKRYEKEMSERNSSKLDSSATSWWHVWA